MLSYQEFLPIPELCERIECFWKFYVGNKSKNGDANPLRHVFPPDGCCSLLFMKINGQETLIFTGPSTTIREIIIPADSLYFGIRLKAGCSGWLHSAEPANIKDQSIWIPPEQWARWQKEFFTHLNKDGQDLEGLTMALTKLNEDSPFQIDDRVERTISFIMERNGNISVDDVAGFIFMSVRQTERIFLKATGITIKKFAQLRRLRKAIIELYVEQKAHPDMLFDRGFSDSAHFYKSFRKITGYSLEKFQQHIRLIDNRLL